MMLMLFRLALLTSLLLASCSEYSGGRSRKPVRSPLPPSTSVNPPYFPPQQNADQCLDASADLCEIERLITVYTNQYRAQQNIPPLTQDQKVSVVARKWSQQQSNWGNIGHAGFPQARVAAYVTTFGSEPTSGISAENVAMTYGTSVEGIAREFATMWYNSSGHRVNMMNSSYASIGVGVFGSQESGSYYATQIFGE